MNISFAKMKGGSQFESKFKRLPTGCSNHASNFVSDVLYVSLALNLHLEVVVKLKDQIKSLMIRA